MTGIPAVIVAAIVSLVAHFAVGAAKSLITIRSWWSSGFQMTWIGALEGAVTYHRNWIGQAQRSLICLDKTHLWGCVKSRKIIENKEGQVWD